MEKKFEVVADGAGRLDILNRITMLYSQRHIFVESLSYSPLQDGESRYTVKSLTDEDTIKKIVDQISKIIDIKSVTYTESN